MVESEAVVRTNQLIQELKAAIISTDWVPSYKTLDLLTVDGRRIHEREIITEQLGPYSITRKPFLGAGQHRGEPPFWELEETKGGIVIVSFRLYDGFGIRRDRAPSTHILASRNERIIPMNSVQAFNLASKEIIQLAKGWSRS